MANGFDRRGRTNNELDHLVDHWRYRRLAGEHRQKTNAQMGWIANVAVGVVGSMLGYWVAGLLGFAAVGGLARFIVAFAGAVLLIFILGKLGVFRKS